MKNATKILALFVVLFLGFSSDIEAQCSMCKAVLESNMQSGDEAVGKGINGGIMYIMFVPYILLAVAGYFTYKHYLKNNKAQA
ncbi:MAG: hypothetical protein JKY48_01915 [Flavobacteriales bacterium]|nr:hypothetical protein [Flavobacteriales bacterium]